MLSAQPPRRARLVLTLHHPHLVPEIDLCIFYQLQLANHHNHCLHVRCQSHPMVLDCGAADAWPEPKVTRFHTSRGRDTDGHLLFLLQMVGSGPE
jgi:hypothetical protein